ncbi:MAG: hypothetical protein JXA15_13825 [Spirochaetales bacterium]|nr:hypothetical protein [Spirochaetales bacterium]
MMDRNMTLTCGYSRKRHFIALVIALLTMSMVASTQGAPAKGLWVLSGGKMMTAGVEIAFGSTSAQAESLFGKPAFIEPWPFSFSWQYAGFLSLDFDDGTKRLSGVRLYLEKSIAGKGVATKIPIDLLKVEVLGVVVEDTSVWDDIIEQASECGINIIDSTPGEELGLSDGTYEAWFYCEKDQGGDLHSIEYFKLPD